MKVEIEISDKVAKWLTKSMLILELSEAKTLEYLIETIIENDEDNEAIKALTLMKMATDMEARLRDIQEPNSKSKWQQRLEKMQQEQSDRLPNQ